VYPLCQALVRPAVLATLSWLAVGADSLAQDVSSQHRTNLFDLRLGTAAADLPEEAFIDYACGTIGGPPGAALSSFRDFGKCKAEPSGLHEVTFRYDDEAEYRFLARGEMNAAEAAGGTLIASYPVYASALFDGGGILRGLRAVTDERTELRQRTNAYMMAEGVQIQFGKDGFACTDTPPANGQEPMLGKFINRTCNRKVNGLLIHTEAHYFRKAGQTEVDRYSGQVNRGQFDSWSRVDIREAGAPLDQNGRPV
jgi:hypothetical protein